jgi:hypothetical protein
MMKLDLPTLSIFQIKFIAYGVVGIVLACLIWQLYRDTITIITFVNDKIVPYYHTLTSEIK